MDYKETYRTTLTYAVSIAGSERALAARLNVPFPLLENWLAGLDTTPAEIFLRAVDVVLAATPEEISKSRKLLMVTPTNKA